MQQAQYKRNSELKFLARMQTSQYMGILLGSIILNTFITFIAVNFVSSLIPTDTAIGTVVNYILVFVVQVATSVLNAGLALICMQSACGMPSSIGDLFAGYHEHTVKIIQISAVITVIETICMIPLNIASMQVLNMMDSLNINDLSTMMRDNSIDTYELMEIYSVFYGTMMRFYLVMLICSLIACILTLPFFPAYYMVIDFPGWSTGTILKRCFDVMSGNKMRLFGLYMSFIPLYMLSMFTCGIALIWIVPYKHMTYANFYLDLMAVRNKKD